MEGKSARRSRGCGPEAGTPFILQVKSERGGASAIAGHDSSPLYTSPHDVRNVEDVHLPRTFVDGVNAHLFAIPAPAGMKVATNLAVQFLRREEAADVNAPPLRVVEKQRSKAVPVGVRVRENPAPIGGVAAMAVLGQDAFPDDLHLI